MTEDKGDVPPGREAFAEMARAAGLALSPAELTELHEAYKILWPRLACLRPGTRRPEDEYLPIVPTAAWTEDSE